MTVGTTFLSVISDMEKAGKTNLSKDIGILKANPSTFPQFKEDYPELFDGSIRKFTKKIPDSILGSVRRAYKQGMDSGIPTYQTLGVMLRSHYKPKIITPIEPEPEIEEDIEDYVDIEEELIGYSDLGSFRRKTISGARIQERYSTVIYKETGVEDVGRLLQQLESIMGQDSMLFPEVYAVLEFDDDGKKYYRTLKKVPNSYSGFKELESLILTLGFAIPTDGIYDWDGDTPGILDPKIPIYLSNVEIVFCQY